MNGLVVHYMYSMVYGIGYGMVWYGYRMVMVWFGMVWYGIIWFGICYAMVW